MSLTSDELRLYFASYNSWLWDWKEHGDVLTWSDGSTIAFRQEVEAVLQRLEPIGFPRFGAIVLLLGACRDTWSSARLEQYRGEENALPLPHFGDPKTLVQAVQRGLEKVYELRSLCSTMQAKAELAALVFEASKHRLPPADSALLRNEFNNGLSGNVLLCHDAGMRKLLLRDLADLAAGLERLDRESLELRLQTGLDQPVEALLVDLPTGEAVRELMRELEQDAELGGVARLAKLLLAAVQLPRPLSKPDDLPIGGVSDISNRGPLDRLVLSELVHDDLTLAVRVAMNEALYLRREPLARPLAQQRFVLIDSGLRMWGVPRVFATAVGLAVAAQADDRVKVQAFCAVGKTVQPIEFGTAAGLTEQLGRLDHHVHPGAALPAFAELTNNCEIASETLLVTCDDVLADREFLESLYQMNVNAVHIAVVGRDGKFRLQHHSRRGKKILRTAQFTLDEVLAPRAKPTTALIDTSLPTNIPAIFKVQPFPLLLSAPVKLENSWFVHGLGTLTITNVGRLLSWTEVGYGAKQLATGLPTGRIHWCSSVIDAGEVLMVVGKLSRNGLYALRYDTRSEQINVRRLQLNFDAPRQVRFHHGAILVIGDTQVEAVDSHTGQSLATCQNPFGISPWGRFFHRLPISISVSTKGVSFVSREWNQLMFDGQQLSFLSMGQMAIQAIMEPVGCNSSSSGPIGIMGDLSGGAWHFDKSGNSRRSELPITLREGETVLAVSRDGQRVVFGTDKRLGLEKKQLVDLITNNVSELYGDESTLVERSLFEFAETIPLRSRFRGIGLDKARRLTLVTAKDTCWPILLSENRNSISIPKTPQSRNQVGPIVLFEPLSSEPTHGRILNVATFPDGSRAVLDNSGLLHLKSSDFTVPECSIVLHDGETAGWVADGRMWGRKYFLGDGVASPAEAIYQEVIQAFIDRLP